MRQNPSPFKELPVTTDSTLNTHVKKFSVYALVAASFGFLLASCNNKVAPPTSPTTWTITVDVTGGSVNYQLQYSPSSGGCKYASSSSDPKLLHVCPGDVLQWQAKSSAKKSEMVIFTSDGILATSGPSSFPASDDQVTSPGQVTSTADGPSTPPHEWYVALYDIQKPKMHHDDPKIIIGQ
jgi:hypothetical protein